MKRRSLVSLVVLLFYAAGLMGIHAQTPAATAWLDKMEPMRSRTPTSFQLRLQIDSGLEKLTGAASWASPDRRCVILCDEDGVPLMIAVDGRVWMYDIISGHILLIRAEPEFLFRYREGRLQSSYGLRADFPTPDSHTTIDFDPAAILRGFSEGKPELLVLDHEKFTATVKHPSYTMTLTAQANQPNVPASFVLKTTGQGRGITFGVEDVSRNAPLPAWHKAISREQLATHVPVVAVADTERMPPAAQLRLTKFRLLIQSGKVYVLRHALRDPDIRTALEKSITVPLDFDEMKANEAALKPKWMAALKEQGFEFPLKKDKAEGSAR